LHAFLIDNARFTIRCALSMLHYGASAKLQEILSNYRPQLGHDGVIDDDDAGHFPSACYLEVIA